MLLMVSTGHALASSACTATSGRDTLPLVELYTSEGCDSCPPADRWLSTTFPVDGTAASVLAFHVDYWDRLGWRDRFASPEYTARQYASMRANGATFVYTPQVLVQGRDVPAWAERGVAAVEAAARTPARAKLSLAVTTPGQGSVDVQASAEIGDAALHGDSVLLVAYVDSGLSSDVRAGENRGVHLRHERVVRDLQRIGVPNARGMITGHARFTRPLEAGVAPTLVAFVQRASNGDVLQTLELRDCW